MVYRALLAVFLFASNLSTIAAAAPAVGEAFTVPAGTMLHCRVTETLTTKLDSQGEAFALKLAEPLTIAGRDVIPAGATLQGHIAQMDRPGRIRGVGQMRLAVERITLSDGRSFPLTAVLVSAYGADHVRVADSEGLLKGPSSRVPDLKEIGAGTGGGMLLGLIFGHPFVGATVGATATTVDRLRRRGKDLTIPVGTQLNYQLLRPLEITPAAARAEGAVAPRGAGH